MKPMLLTSGPLRPDSDKYAFEVKWDGFRALREPGRVWEGHDLFVGQVKYLEWSPAGGLRHASLLGTS